MCIIDYNLIFKLQTL